MNDIATYRVNWEPKHANLRSLATELNLGLDSFIFLDDSSAECNEIQQQCPEVFAVCLPTNTARVPQYFRHLWIFDRPRVTAEDKERNSFYQENAKREQQHAQASSLGDYIASLELKIEIAIPGEAMIPRLAQLSQRTNQFNNTATRYTEADLVNLINDQAAYCRFTNVSDRFGDYGIVGLVTGNLNGDTLAVQAFLMSCRAMSRGVEYRMVQDIGKAAVERGAKWVDIPFIPTPRNKPIANFLNLLPVESKVEQDGKTVYRLTAEQAAALEFQADIAPAEDEEKAPKAEKKSKVAPDAQKVRAGLLEIAGKLDTPKKILQHVKEHNKRAATGDHSYVAPETPVESKLCQLFADILNLDKASVEDSFFDLGGFSLAATLLSSKIARAFPVTCNLDIVSNLKTPRALAAYIAENCDSSALDFSTDQPEERFTEGRCAIGGGELHYARIGHGPTVVLLHGLFGRKEHCYELAVHLAPHHDVIIPDLPGFGMSTNYPADTYRFDNVLSILHEFFENLRLEKFHIGGNSMGASLAGLYAARFPWQAVSVAFLGPPSISCPKVSEVEKLASEGINISVPKTLEQFHQKIDTLFCVKPRVLQDQLDDIGRDEIAQYDAHIAVYDIVKKDDLMLDRYLDQIPCPTLIIWGENDRFKDISGAHLAAEKLAQSELHVLSNAGHALFQEYPERIAALYQEFLGKVESGAKRAGVELVPA
jgi:FkbH-like protein